MAPATRLVRDLGIECDSGDELADALAAIEQAPCRPVLRRLCIQCTQPIALAHLDPILACVTAPALTTLGLLLHLEQSNVDALDRIADSPLRPQLRGLELGTTLAQKSVLLRRYGPLFQQLTSLKLPRTDERASELLREPRS